MQRDPRGRFTEHPALETLDHASAAQEEARKAARRLAARLKMDDPNVRDLETIIRATLRTRDYLTQIREQLKDL